MYKNNVSHWPLKPEGKHKRPLASWRWINSQWRCRSLKCSFLNTWTTTTSSPASQSSPALEKDKGTRYLPQAQVEDPEEKLEWFFPFKHLRSPLPPPRWQAAYTGSDDFTSPRDGTEVRLWRIWQPSGVQNRIITPRAVHPRDKIWRSTHVLEHFSSPCLIKNAESLRRHSARVLQRETNTADGGRLLEYFFLFFSFVSAFLLSALNAQSTSVHPRKSVL